MDGDPEGTPNPLNPVQGMGSDNSAEPATGTGELNFIETAETNISEADSEPGEIKNVGAVDEYVGMGTADFVEPAAQPVAQPEPVAQPTSTPQSEPTAQPEPVARPEAPRPVHTNHSVVDPMMRPATRPTPVAQAAPTRTESSFDSLSSPSDSPVDTLTENIEQVSGSDNLVASDSVVEPKNKSNGKKRGLIACAITLIIVAIICGAAAIAIFVLNNSDRAAAAINKIMNGEVSNIVEAKGTIAINTGATNDEDDTSSLTIDLDGTVDFASSMNKVEASLASETNDTEVNLDLEEITTKGGDTYVKISGLDSVLDNLASSLTTVNTDEYSSAPIYSTLISLYTNIADQIDGEWILLSDDGEDGMRVNLNFLNTSSSCALGAIGNLSDYGKELVTKYKANPFIGSTKENLTVKSKKDEIYKLIYDKEKLAAFSKSLKNSSFADNINECAEVDDESDMTFFEEIFNNLPVVYIEVDKNDNITRVYFSSTIEAEDITTSVLVDLDISYPSELRIVEPSDYVDFSSIFSDLFSAPSLNDLYSI